jgi:hypothetical protein
MRGKGRKKSHTKTIFMNTLLEKVLTDQTAREPEEMETLAVAQDPFESWA